MDLTDLKEAVKTTQKEDKDAFSFKIIHGQMKTMLLGNNMDVMTQSLKRGDGPYLPHGVNVVNMYTEVISGSCGSIEKPYGHSNHYHQGC